jgi:hypothetical protein
MKNEILIPGETVVLNKVGTPFLYLADDPRNDIQIIVCKNGDLYFLEKKNIEVQKEELPECPQKRLEKLIEEYLKYRNKYTELADFELEEYPEEPQIFESLTAYDKFRMDRSRILHENTKLVNKYKSYGEKSDEIKRVIIQMIPSNKWIKTKHGYVGHETNDWPSSDGDFHIERLDAKLKPLRHRIIS